MNRSEFINAAYDQMEKSDLANAVAAFHMGKGPNAASIFIRGFGTLRVEAAPGSHDFQMYLNLDRLKHQDVSELIYLLQHANKLLATLSSIYTLVEKP